MTSVKDFYADPQQEWERLDLPVCRIEFASTINLIDLHFLKGGRVADIGGGPGRYMLELLKRGYRVTLFDISPQNVALAEAKAIEANLMAEDLLVGDARDLSQLKGQRFDGVLALGPLYHLTEKHERIRFSQSC
jgi:S-adenosylmethionine-dependent methyltransferase